MTHTLITLFLDVTAGPAGFNLVAAATYCVVALGGAAFVVERIR